MKQLHESILDDDFDGGFDIPFYNLNKMPWLVYWSGCRSVREAVTDLFVLKWWDKYMEFAKKIADDAETYGVQLQTGWDSPEQRLRSVIIDVTSRKSKLSKPDKPSLSPKMQQIIKVMDALCMNKAVYKVFEKYYTKDGINSPIYMTYSQDRNWFRIEIYNDGKGHGADDKDIDTVVKAVQKFKHKDVKQVEVLPMTDIDFGTNIRIHLK